MKTLKIATAILVVALIAVTGFGLNWLRAHQRLGTPGIKAEPMPGTVVMNIELPEEVLGFTSSNVPQSKVVLGYLPEDTSYAQRFYWDTNGFWATANVILMGTDRSSIHKADYCLAGQGFQTVKKETVMITVPGPNPYEMPIAKWTIKQIYQAEDGSKRERWGIYSFWFVADGQQTVDNTERILWYYRDLLTKRVLQRWAYVSYQTYCHPGQEDAVFEPMKELIAASVPAFQVPLKTAAASVLAQQ
jgi:hypothetical protein